MDRASLLRAYHRALSEKRNALSVRRAADRFWDSHPLTEAITPAVSIVYAAHFDRVAGNGSPAACDAALAKAMREFGA